MRFLALLATPLLVSVCAPANVSTPEKAANLSYTVTQRYPHDTSAFTEGLLLRDGVLYESTGLEGQSDIRRIRLADGKVLQSVKLSPDIFGEGIVDWKDELVSVTWKSGIGYRWNLRNFRRIKHFSYPGEGWGMTQDGKSIYLTDGTPDIRVLDPVTFAVRRLIRVTLDGQGVRNLNEVEWVKGALFANIWQTPLIARIDPANGKVTGLLDLSKLVREVNRSGLDDVLNGIAYDAKEDRLLVTGKNWPRLFALKLSDGK